PTRASAPPGQMPQGPPARGVAQAGRRRKPPRHMRRGEQISKSAYCLVPARLMVNPFERPQPAALPAPWAFIVLPFNVADVDWNVITTGPQVNCTAGHTRLHDHEAELSLPCAVTEPVRPGRRQFIAV